MDRNYGNIIWTNHALQRLKERNIKQGDAWATWRNPDESRFAATRGAWVYHRVFETLEIEVVAKQNEKKEWVILSVWSRPARTDKRARKSFLKLLISNVKLLIASNKK